MRSDAPRLRGLERDAEARSSVRIIIDTRRRRNALNEDGRPIHARVICPGKLRSIVPPGRSSFEPFDRILQFGGKNRVQICIARPLAIQMAGKYLFDDLQTLNQCQ